MEKHGIYAVRVVNQKKKESAIIGPQNISVDKSNMTFVATFTGPIPDIFYSE